MEQLWESFHNCSIATKTPVTSRHLHPGPRKSHGEVQRQATVRVITQKFAPAWNVADASSIP
jgi:hypothetical protein